MKVAIVHDWLVGGGAERVVEQLHKLYPDALIYTSYCSDEWRNKLNGKVVTGYLQRRPFGALRKFAGPMTLLRSRWFNSIDFSGYDLVISSTGNGEAKDITVPEGTTHICYCHSPTHYYWRNYDTYYQNPGFGPLNFAARIGMKLFIGPLRKRDYKAAQKPDYFIANSSFIAAQINKYYQRDAEVINPPVDVDRFAHSSNKERSGFITVGRKVPYKRIDLIVDACTKLEVPLTVIGNGPQHSDLYNRAGPTVSFPMNVSDSEISEYMSSAEAFIFASQEDFGITPVEAMAAGTPVIAYKDGGALDYVVEGKTGTFFEKQTSESIQNAIKQFEARKFDNAKIAHAAKQFSEESFRDKVKKFVTAKVD